MIISLIVAVAENNVIGIDGKLPWRLPIDMKHFVKTTKGRHIIMGRKTYEALGKALKERTNIVITRNKSFKAPDAIVVSSLEDAVKIARDNKEGEAIVIGGAEIYKLALPLTHRMYLTLVHENFEGDTKFPEFDMSEWMQIKGEVYSTDDDHDYEFSILTLDRIKK